MSLLNVKLRNTTKTILSLFDDVPSHLRSYFPNSLDPGSTHEVKIPSTERDTLEAALQRFVASGHLEINFVEQKATPDNLVAAGGASERNAPKAFISHASEDKDRFVLNFARRLRENGVDAWVDKWEMKPGDQLVKKIFEEGLGQADVVIIVLSKTSVQKPWVQRELGVSVVNKINRKVRLIPVVIDDCDIPESLWSDLWERIKDVTSYDESFDRILQAIFGISDKPAVGSPPARFSGPAPKVGGLQRVDELVLGAIYRRRIDEDALFVELDSLSQDPSLKGIPQRELDESISILGNQDFIDEDSPGIVQLTPRGFQEYASAYENEFKAVYDQIAALLVSENMVQCEDLAVRVNKPCSFVELVLELMEEDGYIRVFRSIGSRLEVAEVLPSLRRTMQQTR